jgi:WD40 repeat protein
MRSTLLLARLLALAIVGFAVMLPTASFYTGTVVGVDAQTGRLVIDRDATSAEEPVTRISSVYTGRGDLGALAPRDRVGFAAGPSDLGFEVSGIWKLRSAPSADIDGELVFGHHHNPHHGGIVGMVGEYHVEALVARDGTVRAYVSDMARRPLSLQGFFGKATLYEGEKSITRALVRTSSPTGPALGTRFEEFQGDDATIEFDLIRGDEIINVEFVLPLARAARPEGVMPKRCASSQPHEYYAVSKPWCTMDFGRPVAALDLSPTGDLFVVAAVELPVTVWSLPDGKRRSQFEPPPEVAPAPGHHEHADAPNAVVALPPDGAEAVVVLENRFLRYATDDGRMLGEWPAADGLVLDAQWFAAGKSLLVSIAYRAHLVRVGASVEAPKVFGRMSDNVEAFSVSPTDGRVAVADSEGRVSVFDAIAGTAPVLMSSRLARVSALAFAGEYLAAASKDGLVRTWHAITGAQVGEYGNMPPQLAIKSDPSGTRVVAGDTEGGLHLFTVPALRRSLEMEFHRDAITGLAWAGESILSGDVAGRIAVWRFSSPDD